MKVLVTGVNGQLGHDMMRELVRRGHEAIGSGSGERYTGKDAVSALPYVQMDICDYASVQRTLTALRPDAVVHCSAWTAVDAAEDAENRERVFALNEKGPENIAGLCCAIGASMVYPSTALIFSDRDRSLPFLRSLAIAPRRETP